MKWMLTLAVVVSNLAFARSYLCEPYDIVGTAIYKVGFDDADRFAGYFDRNGQKYYWGNDSCAQQTTDVVRCYPEGLENSWVDISGDPGSYRADVAYGPYGASLDCH